MNGMTDIIFSLEGMGRDLKYDLHGWVGVHRLTPQLSARVQDV